MRNLKLQKKWLKHLHLISEITRRQITVSDLQYQSYSESRIEARIEIVKNYD